MEGPSASRSPPSHGGGRERAWWRLRRAWACARCQTVFQALALLVRGHWGATNFPCCHRRATGNQAEVACFTGNSEFQGRVRKFILSDVLHFQVFFLYGLDVCTDVMVALCLYRTREVGYSSSWLNPFQIMAVFTELHRLSRRSSWCTVQGKRDAAAAAAAVPPQSRIPCHNYITVHLKLQQLVL